MGRKSLAVLQADAEREGRTLYESLKAMARAWPLFRERTWATYVEVIEGLRARRASTALPDLAEEILERTGFEESLRRQGDDDRLDNLAELKRGMAEFASDPEADLEGFLDRAALHTSLDAEGSKDAASIMTIHSAKGLEFDAILVCGLNEGLFPSRRCESPEEMEEERRLLYVAVTRARHRLRLAGADSYTKGAPFRSPSRFLYEMAGRLDGARPKDLELLRSGKPPGDPSSGEAGAPGPRRIAWGPDFAMGDEVEHASFGRGRILAVNLRQGCYTVKFEALSTSRDIMFGASLRKA
jgi:DNA helicase-2/ATP-dependent DNA helicase PcrA